MSPPQHSEPRLGSGLGLPRNAFAVRFTCSEKSGEGCWIGERCDCDRARPSCVWPAAALAEGGGDGKDAGCNSGVGGEGYDSCAG